MVLGNCSIWGNVAAKQGGALFLDAASPQVKNCILWANEPEEIFNNPVSPGNPEVS